MLRGLLIAIVLLLLAPSVCAAEERANVLEADLGSGVLGVGYERTFWPALSGRFTLALNRPWYTGTWGGKESDVIGVGAELRPFLFPFGAAPRGLYFSPFGRLVAIRAEDDLPGPVSGLGWTAGATVGFGWLLADERLLLRFGAGIQYWAFEIEDSRGSAGLRGLYPDVDIIAGYAF